MAQDVLGPYEAAAVNIIRVLTPLLAQYEDQKNKPQMVEIQHEVADETITAPVVTVLVRPGKARYQMGMNQLAYTDDGIGTRRGYWAEDCIIQLKIHARSDAERHHLLNYLVEGIDTAYGLDANGLPIESYVAVYMGETGVILKGYDEPEEERLNSELDPRPGQEPRPEQQTFRMILPIVCDIWHYWVTPLFTFADISAATQAQIAQDYAPTTFPTLNSNAPPGLFPPHTVPLGGTVTTGDGPATVAGSSIPFIP